MRTRHARHAVLVLLLALLVVGGCKRAERYGGLPKSSGKPSLANEVPTPDPSGYYWPKESWDIPIVFVPATATEWSELPQFWNFAPRQPAVVPVALFGLPPPLSLPGLRLAEPVRIKVKVPLGLPDPAPLIPPANAPTLAKWQLGKELFFDDVVQVEKSERLYSCRTCHDPAHGFAENAAVSQYMNRNAPGLINVVYNRRQFWDGRAELLEETIVRDLGEDRLRAATDLPKKHNFVDLAKSLRGNEKYRKRFQEVFGIVEPTPDTVAKALATYLRTILSGNSVFDRAERERGRQKGLLLTPEHFTSVLGADEIAALGRGTVKETAAQLEEGYRLFTGKARCDQCHPLNGLFTDHDFHNIGLGVALSGSEEGRIVHVPIGLKEPRLVDAFRTPSLRALPRTRPYLHDGTKDGLDKVVEHFNKGVSSRVNPYVARPLLAAPGEPLRLNLDERELRLLTLFLEALNGDPVDAVVARPPAKSQP